MAWQPDYVSGADFKTAVGISDTADDLTIGFARTAASRAIDHFTGRQFGVLSAPALRLYTSPPSGVVEIDDLMTATGLAVVVDGTTLVKDTDYQLRPLNAAADGRPWTSLAFLVTVPSTEVGAIEITATWGWTAVPGVVSQAALIQAMRLFKRKDSPFGIAGSPELGSEMRLLSKLDPDVEMMLGSVRRKWLVA